MPHLTLDESWRGMGLLVDLGYASLERLRECQRYAETLTMQGLRADAEWEHLAQIIVHTGRDPNWRRKPSILDQSRGWKSLPST